jgi:predicted RNA-binding protein with PIN domain
MRYFIIDGFNVVHKIPGLSRTPNPHTALINFIKNNKLTGNFRNKVTIVFDGSIDYEAAKEREFTIRFSLEKSADELIKARIEASPNKAQIFVVSDDREIRDFSKLAGAISVRVDEFIHTKDKSGEEQEPESRDISYTAQREITDELRKIWLKE